MVVSSFTGMLAKADIAALDLAANYRSVGEQSRQAMAEDFSQYGLALTAFYIENISVPPEVEKMIDTRSQMGIVGDMGRFTQFQTAQAIPEAAKAGGAGEFMGMGAGIAMGHQMANAMAGSFGAPGASGTNPLGPPPPQQAQQTAAGAQPGGRFCAQCGAGLTPAAKFCPECGTPQANGCPQCGKAFSPGSKFCAECGHKL
jgi:membrane protease subunit (stomatin/prohibitin family)